MRLYLGDVLALAGRLTDQPGFDTARERFRRFLTNWPGTVDDLRSLVDDAQRTIDEQSQRALMDLVVTLGRYLGFAVIYGSYDRTHGAVRFDGAWRSPGAARFVLEVRTDRSRPFSPTDLERTVKALPAVDAGDESEPASGLCVTVPSPGRRVPEPVDVGDPTVAVREWPLDALLLLAERVAARTVSHDEALALLLAERDDPRVAALVEAASTTAPSAAPTTGTPSHLSLVPKEPVADYWIATIIADEWTTAEQFVDAVIGGRQLLGVSAIGILPAEARPGDWVCFFLPGTGVVGHARFGGQLAGTAPLRGAERFAVVFTLNDVELYGTPRPLDLTSPVQRLASRPPAGAVGPYLSHVTERDFRMLTARPA